MNLKVPKNPVSNDFASLPITRQKALKRIETLKPKEIDWGGYLIQSWFQSAFIDSIYCGRVLNKGRGQGYLFNACSSPMPLLNQLQLLEIFFLTHFSSFFSAKWKGRGNLQELKTRVLRFWQQQSTTQYITCVVLRILRSQPRMISHFITQTLPI